jgi:pyruvate dehydrogenase E1 component alpha subunit
MGSHGPISVGMCYANKVPTICFIGDAAAEEDYFLAALGWASTKKLPIIFIVEDNNLSILTEKKVRRNWGMSEVAKGFEIEAYNISDDPTEILSKLKNTIQEPLLLNINTTRLFWHSGAGVDDGEYNDRHLSIRKILNNTIVSQIDKNAEELIQEKWQICLSN